MQADLTYSAGVGAQQASGRTAFHEPFDSIHSAGLCGSAVGFGVDHVSLTMSSHPCTKRNYRYTPGIEALRSQRPGMRNNYHDTYVYFNRVNNLWRILGITACVFEECIAGRTRSVTPKLYCERKANASQGAQRQS